MAEIHGLSRCVSLTSLNLHANNLASLLQLPALPNLTYLNVSSNRIRRIEGLDHLPQLRVLDLTSNEVIRAEHCDRLPFAICPQIQVVEGLGGLLSLECLLLGHNRITSLAGAVWFSCFCDLPLPCAVYALCSGPWCCMISSQEMRCGAGFSPAVFQRKLLSSSFLGFFGRPSVAHLVACWLSYLLP